MKNLLSLLKVNLKIAIRMNGIANSPLKRFGYMILFALLAVVIGASYSFGMYALASSLPEELQIFTLLLGVFASYIAVIFIGSFSMFGNIFAAKDTRFLLTLPISHKTIYTSKFLTTYATNSLIAVAIMMINGIVYSLFVDTSPLFFPLLVIVALTIALIPLTAASLIAFTIVKLSNVLPYKNFFAVIFSLAGLSGYLVLQMSIQQSLMNGAQLSADLTAAIVDSAMRYFPPFAFILNALTDSSLVDLIIYLVISAIFFFGTSIFCSWGYTKSVSFSQGAKTKKNKKGITYKSGASKSVFMHFFINEIRTLLRVPVYAINALSSVIVGPVVIVVPMMSLGENISFNEVLQMASSDILITIVAIFMVFVAGINPAVATIITREGKAFKQLIILPIRPSTVVFGKFLACYSISVLTIIAMAICAYFIIDLSVFVLLAGSLIAATVTLALCAVDAAVDIIKPKLTWENEARAIKQNANVIISMLINWVVLGVFGFLVFFFTLELYAIIAITLVLAVLSLLLLNNIANSRFNKIRI